MINLENKVVSASNSAKKKAKKSEAIVIEISETDSVHKFTNEEPPIGQSDNLQPIKVEFTNSSNEDADPVSITNINHNFNNTLLRQPTI